MITPGFSPTATERVLPKLALDFTTASLDPRITFTRALNTATVTNSSGNIVGVNADLPRFDYDPVTLACKGLLIEEARTNALFYSQQLATLPWTKTGGTVTNNSTDVLSPDGANNATKFDITVVSQVIYFANTFAYTSGSTYTASMYVRGSAFDLYLAAGGLAQGAKVSFNLVNQTATVTLYGTPATVSYQIIPCNNSWYRCVMTITLASTTAYYYQIGSSSVGALYLYGAQLETGAFPTSYIPTTTTALTRNADVATMTGTNFTSWFNATQGTLYAEANTFNAGARTTGLNNICLASIYDGTATNRLQMTIVNATATQIAGRFVAGGTSLIAGTGATFTLGSIVKQAGSYISGNSAIYGNSVVSGTSAGAFTFAPNQLVFGASPNGTAEYLCGWVRKVNFYNIALTQAQLAAITK